MEVAVVYHNPRCSKSRALLKLLQEHQVNVQLVHYLEQPLDAQGLQQLLNQLQLPPSGVLRRGESAAQGLSHNEDEIFQAMLQHPILLERPVVVLGNRAVLARPPERVLELLS